MATHAICTRRSTTSRSTRSASLSFLWRPRAQPDEPARAAADRPQPARTRRGGTRERRRAVASDPQMAVLAAPQGVEASRRAILDAIGEPADLTLVRGVGNRGDDLIAAGTRSLLAERIYREIDLPELPAASGDTVVLSGSGAF